MKIPTHITISTKEYVKIQTKLTLYIAQFGCQIVEMYLDTIPLRMFKKEGKHLGAYIESKVCEEYKVTRYELLESSSRQNISEARQVLCVLCEKHLNLSKTEISILFHKSRHFAKRMISNFNDKLKENHPFDKNLIERYRRLDSLIGAYVDFKPNVNKEPKS